MCTTGFSQIENSEQPSAQIQLKKPIKPSALFEYISALTDYDEEITEKIIFEVNKLKNIKKLRIVSEAFYIQLDTTEQEHYITDHQLITLINKYLNK